MGSEVDVRAFAAAHADGAVVVDVRERHEYAGGHVPGALLMPMGEVRARLAEFRGHRRVYVICASGNRSLLAARWMAAAGIDARSVAGGTAAWIRAGGPVVHGLRDNAA
ncbi:rhodanese-like domain-containing protein [Actinomadura latina]|uniref:Rhodanese-like domain-containing protein n=1 Tax=Actinomadura latina TaxID=163603 RepID=A0A846Z5I3_9ACTN|nr:rhodanese-like domain-containing protein [Actinomadura latina]NKZ05456.1 rhodanese-like domain-containing protein [Actinomadura latina]